MKSAMFNPKKSPRVRVSYSISEETRDKIDELANAYDTTQSAILDALLETYGDALMKEAKRK